MEKNSNLQPHVDDFHRWNVILDDDRQHHSNRHLQNQQQNFVKSEKSDFISFWLIIWKLSKINDKNDLLVSPVKVAIADETAKLLLQSLKNKEN